jgi:Ala-tRNA(Pro) deacylase
MSMPKWIEDTLRHEHVTYHERHHRPRFTSQEVAAEEHISGHRLAKTVIVMADERLAEVVVPASMRVSTEAIRRELGSRTCRLATEQEIAGRFGDCEVGAVPPLRHWPDVPILMDRHLAQLTGPFVFQAGTHEDAIEMEFTDWFRMVQPREGDFTGAIN